MDAERIAELEERIKQRDKRIEELAQERDEERALVADMREHVQNSNDLVHRWIDAFDMELSDKGDWELPQWVAARDELADKSKSLLADWNKFVRQYNGIVAPKRRNFGRPLAASPSQQADVLSRRKRGQPLRAIADETGLSLRTVRTIIEKADGTDRATLARLQRIAPNKLEEAYERDRRRTRDALPRAIAEQQKVGHELLKRAKGH